MNKTKMTSLAKWTLFLTMIDSKFDVTGKTSNHMIISGIFTCSINVMNTSILIILELVSNDPHKQPHKFLTHPLQDISN